MSSVVTSEVTSGLNEEQLRAVEAVRGPVCILAGAGSGKTTTITRRIAHQVESGAFEAADVLAVTFTDKAAGEMRTRLGALGVEGVRARTFHSAALGQLRTLAASFEHEIMSTKALALRQIANTLPKPYKFRPAADLATEIEWAKNRRIGPDRYLDSLGYHEPPIPADLMASVYQRFERGKQERGLIDFEDLLELAIRMYQEDEYARERFHARYKTFTVDEYQDVNLLQETLLREWLGERDELCVVGDDYQSIYGFTGATPRYLLEMPQRFARTTVFRLESNYRSTPEVLAIANRLVPKLGGAEKVLRATREAGPQPVVRPFSRPEAEIPFVIERIRALHDEGVPYEEMAILYRVNFRSEDYEEALVAAGIPYQVQDGAFLNRRSAREVMRALKKSGDTDVSARVRKLADRAGYLEEVPEGLGDQEMTRQADLARLVRLAEEFDDGQRPAVDFVTELGERFGGGEGRGVNLLTYHRAKGLEFDAVFLPRLEVGELPFKRSRSEEATDEERRLFYVGITRARTHLAITWVNDGAKRKGSPFVGDLVEGKNAQASFAKPKKNSDVFPAALGLNVELQGGFAGEIISVDDDGVTIELDSGSEMEIDFGEPVTIEGRTLPLGRAGEGVVTGGPLFEQLKEWRLERARADGVPAYVVFHDKTLAAIAEREPSSEAELSIIAGIGPTKLQRYGSDVIEVIAKTRS